ncbi:ribosylnicotinamide kinase [Fusarium falciforme]|nr:ribosylnicotinamide kinase [Fusarium falciforme]KAJ4252565.1 ribosylnicotinamide kinase [Fusarium falciforme]
MTGDRALIVAISGCSSSGKTTLARLLRDIFPNTFILHEDDFYRPEAELPMRDGLLDWDCPEAIDITGMADSLAYIRQHASFPARREARDGYVTLEGFWADPPGYVDKIVWSNYVEQHAWMFQGGDVEGEFKMDVLEKERIKVQDKVGVDGDIEKTFEWTVDTILDELKRQI